MAKVIRAVGTVLPDAQGRADLAWLRQQPNVDAGRIALLQRAQALLAGPAAELKALVREVSARMDAGAVMPRAPKAGAATAAAAPPPRPRSRNGAA